MLTYFSLAVFRVEEHSHFSILLFSDSERSHFYDYLRIQWHLTDCCFMKQEEHFSVTF